MVSAYKGCPLGGVRLYFKSFLHISKAFLLLWFPSPPLAVSNGKSITQRLSVFVGHAPGVGYPSLCLIPDKLLSPWRVSSSYQLDSCRRDYLHYEQSYKIGINLDFYMLQLIKYNGILQKFSLAEQIQKFELKKVEKSREI